MAVTLSFPVMFSQYGEYIVEIHLAKKLASKQYAWTIWYIIIRYA